MNTALLNRGKILIPILLIHLTFLLLPHCKRRKIEPKIFQVSPDVVWNGEDSQIQIIGQNFFEGAKLNLREGKKEASIFYVYLIGDQGRFDIPFSIESTENVKSIIKKGTPHGDYNLFVEIGNGKKASHPIKVLRLHPPVVYKTSKSKVSNSSEQTIVIEGNYFHEIKKKVIAQKNPPLL